MASVSDSSVLKCCNTLRCFQQVKALFGISLQGGNIFKESRPIGTTSSALDWG